MQEPIEVFEHHGCRVEIHIDPEPSDPREDDNIGVMVCWHRNYQLGDKHGFDEPYDFEAWKATQPGIVVKPLYLYDHSGITISTGSFSCPWDGGQVGWIYALPDKLKEEGIEDADKCLEQEVENYDQYLTNQIYGYRILDEQEELDACWNIYPLEYCRSEAKASADA